MTAPQSNGVQLAITISPGPRDNACGRSVPLDQTKPVESYATTIAELRSEDAWYAAGTYHNGHRSTEDWRSASAVTGDLDYLDATGKHSAPPPEAKGALEMALADAPGCIAYQTPRGTRVDAVLARPVTDCAMWQRAADGLLAKLGAWLRRHRLDADKKANLAGYSVDPASRKPAQFMFAPCARVDGVQRAGQVRVLRPGPYDIEDLLAAAPKPTPEPSPKPKRSAQASSRYEEALERYCAERGRSWGASVQGKCPACPEGHGEQSFGPTRADPSRWICLSTSHPDACGHRTAKDDHAGDALDMDAYLAGRSPKDHLIAEEFYKPPSPREGPPPLEDSDRMPFDGDVLTDWRQPMAGGEPCGLPEPPVEAKTVEVTATEWPDPEPLDTELLPVLPFTPDLLPEALRPWIMDGANRAQTPLEFVGIPAMVALGSLIGRQIAIRPLERDDWSEFANLWGVLVGPPSEMKSQAMSLGVAPLERLAALAMQQHVTEMGVFEKEFAVAKAKAKGLERAIAKAAETGEDTSGLQAQVTPLPEPPPGRRFKVTDCTPEKLGDLLLKNPNGLLLAVDELAGWLHGLEREGHEQERSFYLTGWSGKSAHDIDRISRGSLHIPAVCLSIVGTIQPGVWSNYVREALGSRAGADGFLQRFQLAVWPDPIKHARLVDQYPDRGAKDRATHIFDLLSHIDQASIGSTKGEHDKVPYLRFSPEAQEFAKEFLRRHRDRWRNSTDHAALTAHMIKAQKTWAAIALICHLVDWVTGDVEGGVGLKALEKAIGWVDYIESHARRIYGCGMEKDKSGLQVLASKIKAGELQDGCTMREIGRKHWAGLGDPETIEAVLRQLAIGGWVRSVKTKTKGRARVGYFLNPKIARGDTSAASGTPSAATVTNSGGESQGM